MDEQGVYSYNPSTNEILFRLNPVCKCNREVVQILNEQKEEIYEKDKLIEDLRAEDKRLNQVIINLHNEIGQYDMKVKKQHMIINIQWDIIACLMELKGVIEDE